jgi:hypothetical protein
MFEGGGRLSCPVWAPAQTTLCSPRSGARYATRSFALGTPQQSKQILKCIKVKNNPPPPPSPFPPTPLRLAA